MLNQIVEIYSPATGTDAMGQPNTGWTLLSLAWANLKAGNGLETIKAGGEASSYRVSIRIRYRTDVTPAMRVKHNGVNYNILAVLPDLASRQHVDLMCEVASG